MELVNLTAREALDPPNSDGDNADLKQKPMINQNIYLRNLTDEQKFRSLENPVNRPDQKP